MEWNFTFKGHVLVIKLSGVIDVDDLLKFAREARRIEQQLARTPDRLVDLSEVSDIHLDIRGVGELARHRKSLKFPNEFKSAIFAPQLVHYAFAKMFQKLNTNPQITIKAFRDKAAALAWLKPDDKAKLKVFNEAEHPNEPKPDQD